MTVLGAMDRFRIADVERQAGQAKNQIEYSKKDIAELEERLDQLALKCQALWELLTTGSRVWPREASGYSQLQVRGDIHLVNL